MGRSIYNGFKKISEFFRGLKMDAQVYRSVSKITEALQYLEEDADKLHEVRKMKPDNQVDLRLQFFFILFYSSRINQDDAKPLIERSLDMEILFHLCFLFDRELDLELRDWCRKVFIHSLISVAFQEKLAREKFYSVLWRFSRRLAKHQEEKAKLKAVVLESSEGEQFNQKDRNRIMQWVMSDDDFILKMS